MVATIKIAISIQKRLFDQAEILAEQLNISPIHLFEIAIESFIGNPQNRALLDEINKAEGQPDSNEQAISPRPDPKMAMEISGKREINQGDIYWLQLEEPGSSEPGYPHPHVVIQDDVINRSRVNSVIVCALTSNIKRATEPGNVLLDIGEANLPRQSVMVVSQVSAVDKTQLGEYIGSLSKRRVEQVLAGMRFQQLSFFARYHAR